MKQNKENKRDIERTKKHIIDAAAIEFAANGFKGARVDTIAKRAKVNKAMIYYVFGNKEKLHLSVLRELMELKTKNIFENIDNENLDLNIFIQMLGTYFDDLTEVREYSKILLGDISSGAKALQTLKKENPELFSIMDKVSNAIKKLTKDGFLPALDPQKTALSIVLLMVSFHCFLPCMNLIANEGTKEYEDLSDLTQWKEFFTSSISK